MFVPYGATAMPEQEIPHGPRLSLAFRARRAVLVLGTALGLAAAGSTVVVGAQRGATQGYLSSAPRGDCEFWGGCSDSWWEWPPDKHPLDSPPTAVLPATRRSV